MVEKTYNYLYADRTGVIHAKMDLGCDNSMSAAQAFIFLMCDIQAASHFRFGYKCP